MSATENMARVTRHNSLIPEESLALILSESPEKNLKDVFPKKPKGLFRRKFSLPANLHISWRRKSQPNIAVEGLKVGSGKRNAPMKGESRNKSFHNLVCDRDLLGVPSESVSEDSRNAKTAPPTPEAEARGLPRNAESTSQLEMMSTVYRKSLSNSSYSTKSSDQQNGHSPPKDGSPYKLKKNRNEKFHKLFKCLAEDEVALKSYSCAYFGDILLQGYLYISRNWFCFYSKILGQEKRLTIPVSAVLNITREKTAIFIPNAIGILTSEDKYVFGSLLQRDNAHRLMASVWKQYKAMEACNKEDPEIEEGEENPESGHQVVHDHNNADGESQADSSVSDSSVCFHCGMPKTDHDEQSCELNMDLPDTDRRDSQSGHSDDSNEPNNNVKLKPPLPHKNYMPIHFFSLRNVFRTLSQGISNIQHMPRTSLFLGVCIILVLFLFASAVILFYKVLLLQAILDSSGDWMDQGTYKLWQSHRLYSDMYYLSDQFHAATIQRFHSVLKANIQILTEIQHSLKSLQNSPVLMEKSLNGSS